MASLNKVFLIGNLTRDPELRHTPKGTSVGDLRLAINMNYRTADGTEREEVCYVDIVTWGRQAETCKDYLNKGSPILVEGRLQFEQWEGQNGEKRNRLRVNAERVQFLGRPGTGGTAAAGGSRTPYASKPSSPSNVVEEAVKSNGVDHDLSDPPDDDIPF
jgi:single-strand DNA-binding protein